MTNAERKAEWLAVADHLYNNFSVASGSYLREEAERRFPTIRATESFDNIRCVERGGRRVLQFLTANSWLDYIIQIQDAINAPFTETIEDPSK